MPPVTLSPGSHLSSNSGEADATTARRTFACRTCGKEFARRENLSRHQRTHNPIKPHRCTICQKEFTRSDLRQRHEATHAYSTRPRLASSLSVISAVPSEHAAQNVSPHDSGGVAAQHNFTASYRLNQHGTVSDSSVNPSAVLQPSPDSMQSHTSPQRDAGHDVYSAQQNAQHAMFDRPTPTTYNLMPHFTWDESMADPVLAGTWFDEGFYTALNETGVNYNQGQMTFQNHIPASFSGIYSPVPDSTTYASVPASSSHGCEQRLGPDQSEVNRGPRAPSPPNEASEEDKWPYTWNPRSRDILTAEPLNMSDDHPLFKEHNPQFDISSEFYSRVITFTQRSSAFGLGSRSVVMPSLRVANLFIGLFFQHFEPQMPVLHKATLKSLADLPEPLVAVMIVIGATYCHERHTRRFSIVLLDMTRLSLVLSLEIDNSLMRDSMIMYAGALICHAGLWCGNKRAFELAEVLRGAVVTYCRRNHFTGVSFTDKPEDLADESNMDMNQLWTTWVAKEQRKRLCWIIFILDCQFPCLLNLPSTIFVTELATVDCPCDEEFWQASSARKWKRLLGPASVPPSKAFSSAIGPFMGPVALRVKPSSDGQTPEVLTVPDSEYAKPISLNSWSRFLVLLIIHIYIFEFSQRLSIAREILKEEIDSDSDSDMAIPQDDQDERSSLSPDEDDDGSYTDPLPGEELFGLISGRCGRAFRKGKSDPLEATRVIQTFSTRMNELLGSIDLFSKAYLNSPPSDLGLFAVSRHFHEAAATLVDIGFLLIYCSVLDLQNALGKSGPREIPRAMSNLCQWANSQSTGAIRAAAKAIQMVDAIAKSQSSSSTNRITTSPPNLKLLTQYEIIAFFISNVLLWAFASAADEGHKQHLLRVIHDEHILENSGFLIVMEKALSTSPHSTSSASSAGDARTIFRSAAEILPRLSNWGAALNLALLLHQRSQL